MLERIRYLIARHGKAEVALVLAVVAGVILDLSVEEIGVLAAAISSGVYAVPNAVPNAERTDLHGSAD
jgi:hypothetical protein